MSNEVQCGNPGFLGKDKSSPVRLAWTLNMVTAEAGSVLGGVGHEFRMPPSNKTAPVQQAPTMYQTLPALPPLVLTTQKGPRHPPMS